MIFTVRVVFVTIYCIVVCVIGSFYCLFSFRNPKHVATFGHIFGFLAPFFGLKVEIRKPKGSENFGNAVYIANHQNNYDMITVSNIVQPLTVTVGKKSILWIPFFGQLYWLSGNLLIDRNSHIKAYNTILKLLNFFKDRRISVWMFPEGTRSRGRGLLPFKIGAFYIAISAKVPIVPVCVSNTYGKINLNRINNGLVIVEMLTPIETDSYTKNQARELAAYCHEIMFSKIEALNKEVEIRNLANFK